MRANPEFVFVLLYFILFLSEILFQKCSDWFVLFLFSARRPLYLAYFWYSLCLALFSLCFAIFLLIWLLFSLFGLFFSLNWRPFIRFCWIFRLNSDLYNHILTYTLYISSGSVVSNRLYYLSLYLQGLPLYIRNLLLEFR